MAFDVLFRVDNLLALTIILAIVGGYVLLGLYEWRKMSSVSGACISWMQGLLLICGLIGFLGGPTPVRLGLATAVGISGGAALCVCYLRFRKR